MPVSKRTLLEQLTRSELQTLADEHGLSVDDKRVRDQLVDAAASSRRVKLVDVLATYPRDRLKDLCRALGLDDSGNEKLALIERLVGAEAPDSAKAIVPASAVRASNSKPKRRTTAKRRTAGHDTDAAVSGSLKAALRQFAVGAAGGYTGRDSHVSFTTHLLESFGWPNGRPTDAEIPRTFSIADGGRHVDREVALWWPERGTMMDVVDHDAALGSAWKDLVRVCLQLDPNPQYVVLTNQRDLQLYDLARDREAPRLSIPIDDLPKYSEAFPFFTTDWKPGAVPKIVNVEKVSGEVADLVARLYRSVRTQHPDREHDVIRFTLQCITAMFAEDIELLRKDYFTSLLYDGAKNGNVEARIRELFEQMNQRDLPTPRVVPYFNGGLFTDVVTLPLGPEQVTALTKAAEANWKYVDPHIFGSVFQGIMDDAERHAQGVHYTAQDDIMRVVGPTIVEPWRKRIQAASSLKELTDLRKELLAYRVLDPACGSGNFLYVAFRELYRLDTELLSRMREFPSTAGKLSWNGGISATNFYGLDINRFAVELAKVTLNIAKKIAYDERKAQAFALGGQVEMDIDPSLPLDNLDQNIVWADALFTEWPPADAIVGNPPILGDRKIRGELRKIRGELADEYVAKLKRITDGALVDLSCYWFRLAHNRLPPGGRAGLVGTSGIRVGKAKAASLDYIVERGGTITNAVSSREWPGEAALNVSMVNWTKGDAQGPFQLIVDDHIFPVARIQTHLQLHVDLNAAREISSNDRGTSMGVIFGTDLFMADEASHLPLAELRKKRVIRPVASGTPLLTGALSSEPELCVYLASSHTEHQAASIGGAAFKYIRTRVRPYVESVAASYDGWLERWWQVWRPRPEFFGPVFQMRRFIVCSNPQARPIFEFLSSSFVPTNTLQVFAFEDDYSFGVIHSSLHWAWTKAKGGKVTERIRYTSEVWRTFPWPQDPTEAQLVAVAQAGRELRRVRAALMAENGWSLRQLYQAAEVDGQHPLKDAQAALDAAVRDAYGVPPDQDPIAFLLELNQLVTEDEEQGREVRGPGLPAAYDRKDQRWMSTDCIEPPKN